MAKIKRLADVFRFPGFVPFSSVRGVFGDHRAVVIRLRRRQKKRRAVFAEKFNFVITTNGLGESATSRAVTGASTWLTRAGVSIACGARL